jgi:hypothetical protein
LSEPATRFLFTALALYALLQCDQADRLFDTEPTIQQGIDQQILVLIQGDTSRCIFHARVAWFRQPWKRSEYVYSRVRRAPP